MSSCALYPLYLLPIASVQHLQCRPDVTRLMEPHTDGGRDVTFVEEGEDGGGGDDFFILATEGEQ